MKPFLKKISTYLLIVIFVCCPVIFYCSKSVGSDVDQAMALAMKKYPFKIKKIRLGDSVGKNIWKTGYDSAKGEVNLACNQAISILGHVMMLRSILYYNETDPDLVIEGYFRPGSFLTDLNQKFTRGYFLKKFYNDEWFFNSKVSLGNGMMTKIDNEYLQQYQERKLYRYLYFRNKCLLGSPYFFESYGFENDKLNRHLYELLLPEMGKIRFISNPISNTYKDEELKKLAELKDKVHMTMPIFLNDSFFVEDKTHLKTQYREKGYDYLLAIVYKRSDK